MPASGQRHTNNKMKATSVVVRSEAVSLLQTRAWAVEFHGEIFALSDIDVA